MRTGFPRLGVLLAAFMTSLGGNCSTSPAATPRTDDSSRSPASTPSWDNEQVGNAVTIVTVGAGLSVPPRGQIIALATAIQESGLRNLTHGDQDSLGLFQQRPSQGWGTPAQILDPVHAATRFYQALLAEPGWQTLPLTVAAQDVQHSGHPDAYAVHEGAATHLYAAITGTGTRAITSAGGCIVVADELTPPSLPAALAPPSSLAPSLDLSWLRRVSFVGVLGHLVALILVGGCDKVPGVGPGVAGFHGRRVQRVVVAGPER